MTATEAKFNFDYKSAVRTDKAVNRVEKMSKSTRQPVPRPFVNGTRSSLLGQLTADLAYNSTDTVRILEGAVGSEAVPGTYDSVTAHNLLYRKLWTDSFVWLEWPIVVGSSENMWRIVWSDSATRLRGTTAAAIAAGASGTVNTLKKIDGKFGSSSITAYNVNASLNIASGKTVFCEWCQETGHWEIYAADC